MTNVRVIKPALAALVAAAACVGGLAFSSAQPAQADTYSDLINAQNQHAASVQREAELKQQLAGVNQELADKVLELDDLTNNKIVAAQAKVTQANEDAATAQDEADAASERLSAAQKDKETLEEQIKQTGKDYDDAHAAVAQLARDEMHGSNASDVMSVVTGATSTQDFVNSMQSRDALSRNEANAASSAANSLSTSRTVANVCRPSKSRSLCSRPRPMRRPLPRRPPPKPRKANVTLWTSYVRKAKQGVTNCLP